MTMVDEILLGDQPTEPPVPNLEETKIGKVSTNKFKAFLATADYVSDQQLKQVYASIKGSV